MRRISVKMRDDLTELLAQVYLAIEWRRIHTSKNAWDIWNHRLRAAATRATMGAFVSSLCDYFSVQSLPPDATALADALEPHASEVLDYVCTEHIPVAMRAVARAKNVKQKRRKGDSHDSAR